MANRLRDVTPTVFGDNPRRLGFAGIYDVWTAPNGTEVFQVATVTCEPSDDVRAIHHRMGVILDPVNFAIWLSGENDHAAALMVPTRAGHLTVEEAKDVNWQGA